VVLAGQRHPRLVLGMHAQPVVAASAARPPRRPRGRRMELHEVLRRRGKRAPLRNRALLGAIGRRVPMQARTGQRLAILKAGRVMTRSAVTDQEAWRAPTVLAAPRAARRCPPRAPGRGPAEVADVPAVAAVAADAAAKSLKIRVVPFDTRGFKP
jgi:hypothetical protein